MLKEQVDRFVFLTNEIKTNKEELEKIKSDILKEMAEKDVNPLISKNNQIQLFREIKSKSTWNYPLVIDTLLQVLSNARQKFDIKIIMKYDDAKIKKLMKQYPDLKRAEKVEKGDEFLVMRVLKEGE